MEFKPQNDFGNFGLDLLAPPIEEPVEDWSLDGLRAELVRFWELANIDFFEGSLKPVVFTFAPTREGNLGHYLHGGWHLNGVIKDEVNLNPLYFERPINEKLVTLVHEAGHQWQQETGRPSKNPKYHNRTFREKLRAIGIPCDNKGVTTSTEPSFIQWVSRARCWSLIAYISGRNPKPKC